MSLSRRLLAVCATAALSTCGPDVTSSSNENTSTSTPGWAGPVGTLQSPLLGSPTAKVVVRRAQLVWSPVTIYDGATDSNTPVACTGAADCAAYTGSSCVATLCQQQVMDTSLFYVGNVSAPISVKLPCDANSYVVEVYGGSATAPHALALADMKQTSAPVSFPTGCTPAPTPAWTATTAPTLTLPASIYVGLAAPNDAYTVQIGGLAYPWAASKWGLTAAGVAPTNTGNPARFLAPTTSTADISFAATWYLDTSMLLTGETVTDWVYAAPAVTKTPTPSGSITP